MIRAARINFSAKPTRNARGKDFAALINSLTIQIPHEVRI